MSQATQLAASAFPEPPARVSSLPLRTETLKDVLGLVVIWDKIELLRHAVGLADDVLLNPLHFLATLDHTRQSCSVACWQGLELVGLMYATEHRFRGRRLGYAVGGDFAGRGLLLCRPEFEAAVLAAGLQHLASQGIHSMHLRLLPRNPSIPSIPGLKIRHLDGVIPGDRLALAPDFEAFLATLGKHTRRNMRNFMRKTERAGIEFVPGVEQREYQAAVERMNGKATFRLQPSHLLRDERVLALHSGAQRFGLRSPDGSLVAVLCGFTQAKRFHLLTQVNDVSLQNLSLSLVLRGHTVRHLIECGHTELQFMGGTALTLGRFCAAESYRSIFADKEQGAAAAAKSFLSNAVRVSQSIGTPLPRTLQMICSGHLEEKLLLRRTPLAHAALVFPENEHA